MLLHIAVWTSIALLYTPLCIHLYRGSWEKIDYTHAYFILPVALWLVWRMRDRVAKLALAGKGNVAAGIAFLAFGLATFAFGWKQGYTSLSTFSMIPTIIGAGLYLYGGLFVRALWFPLLYLLLLVPPPLGILDSITLPMRYGVSVVTASLLSAFHYPIVRDGLLLKLGGHEIYMGAPCSGFRSLITMISLGLVYAFISKARNLTRWTLVASIVPFALVGNLIRVTSVCLATFYFGEKIGQYVHDGGGFVIFIILIAGMVGLETVMEKMSSRKVSSLKSQVSSKRT